MSTSDPSERSGPPSDAEVVVPADLFAPSSQFRRERWVRDHRGQVGFVGSNPQTFTGRFLTFWTNEGAAYSTSLSDLVECSQAAADWLDGYLSGSEPNPRLLQPGFDWDPADEDTERWTTILDLYHRSGVWGVENRTCEVCGEEVLPSCAAGSRCAQHGGDRSNWPTIV